MKIRVLLTLAALTVLCGCTNEYGQFRPPDPLGRALFNVIDPPPANAVPIAQPYVVTPMPPQQVESQPPAPNYGTPIWIGGYWGWTANQWQWVPGHWVQPPHPGARWITPRYYSRGGQWYWQSGTWR